MITFTQFLAEARMAPLYHGTSVRNATVILMSNKLSPKTSHSSFTLLKTPFTFSRSPSDKPYPVPFPGTVKRIMGVSTSRNLTFAKTWATKHLGSSFGDTVIFELDQQKLTQRYQIKPVNFFMDRFLPSNNEFEEFIITDTDIPINKYLLKVHVFDEWVKEKMEPLLPSGVTIKVH